MLHNGHRSRLRKRLRQEGFEGFEDHQVLELLLGYAIPRRDTNELAHLLLNRFGTISAVMEADPSDLETIDGIGEKASLFLTLMPALVRRYQQDRAERSKPLMNHANHVADFLIPLMAGRTEEVFYLLCLDTRCRLLFPALVGEGTVQEALVHPRKVVETALRHKASSVILAHNHPSGSLDPSPSDLRLTKLLTQAFTPLNIRVLDHIIVAGKETCSFSEKGFL